MVTVTVGRLATTAVAPPIKGVAPPVKTVNPLNSPAVLNLDQSSFIIAPPVSNDPTTPINPAAPTATDAAINKVAPQPIFMRPSDVQSNPVTFGRFVNEVEQTLQPLVAAQHSIEAGPPEVGFGRPNGFDFFQVVDQTTQQVFLAEGIAYSGPGGPGTLTQISQQFVDITTDNLNITSDGPRTFIHSGAGDDVLQATPLSSSNQGSGHIFNAAGGSNVLIGNDGVNGFKDILMADADPTKSVTNLFQGFESGDDIVVRGLTLQDFTYSATDNAARTQLQITATQIANPAIETSIMVSGFTTQDLSNGKLIMGFSSDGLGSNFMVLNAPFAG